MARKPKTNGARQRAKSPEIKVTGPGKRFAYYDKEPREGHPWGEPAQRPLVIKDGGRFKRVYEDGTLAEGHVSSTALEGCVEIGTIATNVEILPEAEPKPAVTSEVQAA